MDAKEISIEELAELNEEFGVMAVLNYRKIAKARESRGIGAIANSIEEGTKKMVDEETERVADMHNRFKNGESTSAIAERYRISTIEVANILKQF